MISPGAGDPQSALDASRQNVRELLDELRDGRREALDELFPIVYREIRALAHRSRRSWNAHDTLTTTVLVHELYLKLVGQEGVAYETEAHFMATAAKAIRHVLINYARDRSAQKRGGGWERLPLAEAEVAADAPLPGTPSWEDRVMGLDAALERLAELSEEQSRVVECRFFAGMTVEQTAVALGVSTATVTRRWAVARAWLRRELTGGSRGAHPA
jgi:RNA polymerase sigma factor (TIGR02999 family)